MRLVDENLLDEWCRGHRQEAQSVVVELVWRLLRKSAPLATRRRLPLGDSLNQPGADVYLETQNACGPFVPCGKSHWEIGIGTKAGDKATKDYRELTKSVSAEERRVSTFVFVTPLSGVRSREGYWKPESQQAWVAKRKAREEWCDVRVIDGTQLVDWLTDYPLEGEWLARRMGMVGGAFEPAESRWSTLRSIGAPPELKPEVFLQNREGAQEKINQCLALQLDRLQLDTHYPSQVGDFVAACIESLEDDARTDAYSRTAILGDVESLKTFADLEGGYVLVAGFEMASDDPSVRGLLESARKKGHVLIFAGPKGGRPSELRVDLREPKPHQLQEALMRCGYADEKARVLAHQSGGSLNVMLSSLRELAPKPDWATGAEASELMIAELLGGWVESSAEDRTIAALVSLKSYDTWVAVIREMLDVPGTPIAHADGAWRVTPRFEAWFQLGSKVFEDHLTRLRDAAITVLSEIDPKFDLPEDERFAANVRGKVLKHSGALRSGMADTLALLGSHPDALDRCRAGLPESIAIQVVRDVLSTDDWRVWAGLGELLPMLAEAAPIPFLEAVERACGAAPSPFEELFAQESSGIMGHTYISGLLWALETLAWDARHVARVLILLGDLSSIDPGGNWANRPDASMADILLPWHRQTTATLEQRMAAFKALAAENPDAAWKLLQRIMPSNHQVTSGTRKPAWRQLIPEDWTPVVSRADYAEQVEGYVEVAIGLAKNSIGRMCDLVSSLDDLPPVLRGKILGLFEDEPVRNLPEREREPLWRKLNELVARHRKYSHTEWALPSADVDEIAKAVEALAPRSTVLLAKPLFSEREFDLLDGDDGDYEAQHRRLEERRRSALLVVLEQEGLNAVERLAEDENAGWKVGWTLGHIGSGATDDGLFPRVLGSGEDGLSQLALGYVRARHAELGWSWVEGCDTSRWLPDQIARFYGCLPFTDETWTRAETVLREESSTYWRLTPANPYEETTDRDLAVRRLVENGRPWAAVDVVDASIYKEEPVSIEAMGMALHAAATVESGERIDVYSAAKVLKTLQQDPSVEPNDICTLEWFYLPVLDGTNDDSGPVALHRALATEPAFFCEMLSRVFSSEKESAGDRPETSEEDRRVVENTWRLLYGWKRVPGLQDDGTFEIARLEQWWNEVAEACAESGHLGVAMERTGQVLAYSPTDSDGLWIDRGIAAFLNRKEFEDMRQGFRTALFNRRGVHGFTHGAAEQELADSYNERADAADAAQFHRVAEAMRSLGEGYAAEASREASRDPGED